MRFYHCLLRQYVNVSNNCLLGHISLNSDKTGKIQKTHTQTDRQTKKEKKREKIINHDAWTKLVDDQPQYM